MEFLISAAAVCISAAAAYITMAVYFRIPPGWLCDYGEEPEEKHLPENRCSHPAGCTAALTAVSIIMQIILMRGFFIQQGNYISAAASEYREMLFLSGGFADLMVREIFLLAGYAVLMTAALADAVYMIIPDQCCAALLVLSLLRLAGANRLQDMLTGAALAGGLMLVSMFIGRLAAGAGSTGMGDLKLMAACGAYLGASWGGECSGAVLAFYVTAVLSNGIWSALLVLLKKTSYGEPRPFGPWIAVSALLCMAAA